MIKSNQPGSEPIRIPRQIPNPAFEPMEPEVPTKLPPVPAEPVREPDEGLREYSVSNRR